MGPLSLPSSGGALCHVTGHGKAWVTSLPPVAHHADASDVGSDGSRAGPRMGVSPETGASSTRLGEQDICRIIEP